MNEQDGSDTLTVQRWTSRIAKMAQPDLDFIGIKTNSSCPLFFFKYSTLMKYFCFHSFLLLFCLSMQHQLFFHLLVYRTVFVWDIGGQKWNGKINNPAPEVQAQSTVSAASDMFSLGLVVAAIFNRGRPLIQANHRNPNYTKQMDMVRSFLPS